MSANTTLGSKLIIINVQLKCSADTHALKFPFKFNGTKTMCFSENFRLARERQNERVEYAETTLPFHFVSYSQLLHMFHQKIVALNFIHPVFAVSAIKITGLNKYSLVMELLYLKSFTIYRPISVAGDSYRELNFTICVRHNCWGMLLKRNRDDVASNTNNWTGIDI